MNNLLVVHPDQMTAADGGLTASHLAAGNNLATLVASTTPMPAGADDVSLQASALFSAHSALFNTTTFSGLSNSGMVGSQTIAASSEAYQASDVAGGYAVAPKI